MQSSLQVQDVRVTIKPGAHSIGLEEYDGRAISFEDENMKLSIDGEKGTELSGHWMLLNGAGDVSGVALFEVVKLANDGFHIDELGDNCIAAEGGSWIFSDCEVRLVETCRNLIYRDRHNQSDIVY